MKQVIFGVLCLCLIKLTQSASSAVNIPTIEEFCDALTDAIKRVPDHQADDDDFIDAYCDYIHEEHKLEDYAEYDDLNDFDHLVVHYRQYKKSKKVNKEKNKNAKTIKDPHGMTFKEEYGDNIFSDLTPEEIKKRFPGGNNGNNDVSSARHLMNDEGNVRRLGLQYGCTQRSASYFANINNQVENNLNWAFCNNVYSQGATNACWAFATTSQAECNYRRERGRSVAFSTQHFLDCSGDYEGTKASGGFFGRGARFVENGKGFCEAYQFPFNPARNDINGVCNCFAPMQGANCYAANIRNNFDLLTRIIASGRAVSFGMKFDTNMQNARGNMVSACNPYDPFGAYNHAMTIVGQYYGQYVKVKNSHGTYWGNQGYVWMPRSAFESCLSDDYVYWNEDFRPFGYAAEANPGQPQIEPQSPKEQLFTNDNSNNNNIAVDGTSTKNIQYYISYMYGFIGIIIGIIGSIICGLFIYCSVNCTKGFKLNNFKYKKVGIPSDTSDSDTMSINM